MKIRQHRPGFVDSYDDPAVAEFDSLDALKQIPFVRVWTHLNDFYRLAVDLDPVFGQHLLMAELDYGKVWYVIGYLEDADESLLDQLGPRTQN